METIIFDEAYRVSTDRDRAAYQRLIERLPKRPIAILVVTTAPERA